MQITVLFTPGCPHWQTARERVDHALRTLNKQGDIKVCPVETDEHARRIGFHGSPTILIDGRDPFAADGGSGLACRLYPSPTGACGTPTVEQLVTVLR